MKAQRIINIALVFGLVVSLVGGAITVSKLADVARSNSTVVCVLGKAASVPLKQRAEENRADFRKRVKLAREFVALLREELDNCNAERPPVVTVDPESRHPHAQPSSPNRDKPSEDGSEGGGRSSGSNPPSQPGPPQGGPPGNPTPPGNPNPGPPADKPDVSVDLSDPCPAQVAGIEVCLP